MHENVPVRAAVPSETVAEEEPSAFKEYDRLESVDALACATSTSKGDGKAVGTGGGVVVFVHRVCCGDRVSVGVIGRGPLFEA